ncbi:MAG: hypothetical protein Q7S00_07365 [bacterium]|nr:hypothetical protein [bacterium]
MKKTALLVSLFSLFLAAELQAQTSSTIPTEYPNTFRGARQLGMGNAGMALSGTSYNGRRDSNQWFYNPAATNDYEKDFRFDIMEIQGDMSHKMIGLVTDVLDLKDAANAASTSVDKTNVFNNFIASRIGNYESAGARIIPFMMTHRWFSVALLADTRSTISFRNRAFSNIEVFSRSDGGGVVGTAIGFFEDHLQAGLNLKVLHRFEVNEVVTLDDILNTDDLGAGYQRGTGVGVDLGLKGRIPEEGKVLEILKPTLAVTYQDVGNTRFTGSVSDNKQSVSAGLAIHPVIPLWAGLGSHLAVDFRELNQSSTFIKKLAVGYEIEMPPAGFFHSAVRIGANKGYVTGGFTADLKYFKLEGATYGEEMGTFSRQKEARRFAFNMQFGF